MLVGAAPPASAQWFLVPTVGVSFASDTNLIDLDLAAGGSRKLSLQGSVLWLGDSWYGLDGEVGYISGFFENERERLVSSSSVLTVMGSVVLTLPLSVTRNSLRPFAIGGFGLIRAVSDDVLNVLPVNEKLLGLRIGGGAVGFLTDTTGLRWDLSYIRTLKGQGDESGVAFGSGSRSLSFWRGSMGLVLRF